MYINFVNFMEGLYKNDVSDFTEKPPSGLSHDYGITEIRDCTLRSPIRSYTVCRVESEKSTVLHN